MITITENTPEKINAALLSIKNKETANINSFYNIAVSNDEDIKKIENEMVSINTTVINNAEQSARKECQRKLSELTYGELLYKQTFKSLSQNKGKLELERGMSLTTPVSGSFSVDDSNFFLAASIIEPKSFFCVAIRTESHPIDWQYEPRNTEVAENIYVGNFHAVNVSSLCGFNYLTEKAGVYIEFDQNVTCTVYIYCKPFLG